MLVFRNTPQQQPKKEVDAPKNQILVLKKRTLALQTENYSQKKQIVALQRKIDSLTKHPMLLFASKGEKLICKAVGGKLQTYGRSYDIQAGIYKLEVKSSNRAPAVKGYPTGRWVWSNPLGVKKEKDYNFLVLIAWEKDGTYRCFLVPRNDVEALTDKGPHGGTIRLSTNPIRSQKSKELLLHGTTIENIEAQFKVLNGKSE